MDDATTSLTAGARGATALISAQAQRHTALTDPVTRPARPPAGIVVWL